MRQDLLSLTLDDLAAMTNRGTVKRAAREVEEGDPTHAIVESEAGEVRIDWSDGASCIFPAGKTASDARCNCIATTLCRHVVKSVLAYQMQSTTPATGDAASEPVAKPQEPWDPGEITDEALAHHFKKPVLVAAQARFAQGVLVDLVRSAKPTARFHQLACSLRFIVPGDVRYTHCDCAEPAPCSHALLAVWAFRLLPKDRAAGFIATQQADLAVPGAPLDAAELLLRELAESGIAGLSDTWNDRVLRLAPQFEGAELIWPWEVLSELIHEHERYTSHDARFAPERVAQLVGEWLIRADAIRSQTRSVPQLLIRGSSTDRTTEIGSARYVGVGCGAEVERGGVTLTAFMQDVDSGSLVAVSRDFTDPKKDDPEPPREFRKLAEMSVVRGISLAALGAGQLLLQGGKRAPDHRLIVGRAKASSNPQAFAWETLRAPLLVSDYGELRARLSALPPASLRPRYIAEDLHVLPVSSVAAWHFDEASQRIVMSVVDARDEQAAVVQPYVSRASEGCEALLVALADEERRLLFVAGQVRASALGLVVHPTALVFERKGKREAIQPWVDRFAAPSAGRSRQAAPHDLTHSGSTPFLRELQTLLGDQFLSGVRRADARAARAWDRLARLGEVTGFARLAGPSRKVAEGLSQKLSTPNWRSEGTTAHLLYAALLGKIAHDVG